MMNETSLYIHIPFCARKCMYCDFPSFCGKDSLMEDYASSLAVEIEKRASDNLIKTIFIGGGTPTYLSLAGWNMIKSSLDRLQKQKRLEFTVECNPGTITREKLELFKDAGVNRLSIGLQAWQNELLTSLGRIHTLDQFMHGYKLARKMGFDNINIDLMFALPEQTLEQWKQTLEESVKLGLEHISCYSLIVEEGTPFYNLNQMNKLKLPSEELEREMYYTALEILSEKGYEQYEISNFSKPGKECSHNMVYWQQDDYIGCGAAAHSFIRGKRYRNEENIEKYIGTIIRDGSAVIETVENSKEDNMEEFMFMGLRMIRGISKREFNRRFSRDIDEIYGDVIDKHRRNGLLVTKEDNIFLSKKGIELSNIVMSDFIIS